MQVSVETLGPLGRRLKVAVAADKVEQEFSVRLQRLSKQVKMPGFRPGKVPLKMVEAQYGGRLMDEMAGGGGSNTSDGSPHGREAGRSDAPSRRPAQYRFCRPAQRQGVRRRQGQWFSAHARERYADLGHGAG